MKINENFKNWCFYCGHSRYGQFKGYTVIVADPDGYSDDIYDLVCDLSGSDFDAIESARKLYNLSISERILMANDDNPVIAMQKVCDLILQKKEVIENE